MKATKVLKVKVKGHQQNTRCKGQLENKEPFIQVSRAYLKFT